MACKVFNKSKNIEEAKLYGIQWIWNGGRKMETKICVWADKPEPVNEIAIKKWTELSGLDTEDNVDGKNTKPGECYEGFACIEDGQGSLMISVSEIKNPSMLSTTMLKKVLESRNLKNVAKGLKGGEAKQHLEKTLDKLLDSTSDEEKEEEDENNDEEWIRLQ